ncbi:MAG: hypothetical protein ACFCUI_07610 [Bernardetiaceae bacterium]
MYFVVEITAMGQIRQHLCLAVGATHPWSTLTKEDEVSDAARFFHTVSMSYGIGWMGQLDEKNAVKFMLRASRVNSGFKVDWSDVGPDLRRVRRRSSFVYAPPQVQISWIRELHRLGERWTINGILGAAYSHQKINSLSGGGGQDLINLQTGQIIQTINYRLKRASENWNNVLVNVGSEITFSNFANQFLVLRLDAQFGLITAIKETATYELIDYQNGTTTYGSSERLLRGSNLSLELAYRFPFMERRYQRKLAQKKK